MSPSLSWDDEFEYVKLKLKRSINKLIAADMKLHKVYMCFNACIVINVFLDVALQDLIRNNVMN